MKDMGDGPGVSVCKGDDMDDDCWISNDGAGAGASDGYEVDDAV